MCDYVFLSATMPVYALLCADICDHVLLCAAM
jgi:hypothetical protein